MISNGIYSGGLLKKIYPEDFTLLPNTNQYWELDMAYGELESMTNSDLIKRSAFFAKVDGEETHHFKICKASPLQVDKKSSLRRQTFFNVNQFKTGYATHGLFPYRGKFHPQLIKGIMNLIGLKRGDTVLDPMAGSGTVGIEAAINGINSISVDVSPFCTLMSRAKVKGLVVDAGELNETLENGLYKLRGAEESVKANTLFQEAVGKRIKIDKIEVPIEHRELLLLAYLDAVGYAARRKNKTGEELYPVIVDRYVSAIKQFGRVRKKLSLTIGEAEAREGDAKKLDIQDETVDGVITSPPYSFAIDYADNDRPQLEYLGYDVELLRDKMIGLTGGRLIRDRVEKYFKEMEQIFSEMYRVLKPGKSCVVVIGSNEIQTKGIRHEVEFAKFGEKVGFKLVWNMVRPIEGIRNSMRDEYVMFFQKNSK